MLLPDNIHPELSVYYNGYIILKELRDLKEIKLIDLFHIINNKKKMSFSLFMLSLNWLYLIDILELDGMGVIKKCI